MTPIHGIVRNGKIEIDAPAGFSEGSEVRIWLDETHADSDEPMSQEEINRTLEAMSQMQPLVFTESERLEWQRMLDEQRALEIASAESRATKLLSQWE